MRKITVKELKQKGFDRVQTEEIKKGLKSGVDIHKYLDPNLFWKEMECIREGLENGVDLTPYIDKVDPIRFTLLARAAKAGMPIEGLTFPVDEKNEDKVNWDLDGGVIRAFEIYKVDVSDYFNLEYESPQCYLCIAEAIKKGLDVSLIANPEYSGWTMGILIDGLLKGRTIEEMKADEELSFFFED